MSENNLYSHELLEPGPSHSSPARITLKKYHNVHISDILSKRSWGFERKSVGYTNNLLCKIYSSYDAVKFTKNTVQATDASCSCTSRYRGGIFNLEFSLDGKLLAAACEAKQVVLFDAANQKEIKNIENAHHNCVNCIRFLDDRTFATGSDDTLIRIWDLRNLKSSVRTLHGHSNWVKNIEWSEPEQLLVSSAFDGAVYAWNLREPSEYNVMFDKVFLMNGLMRMKLTPDGTKMVISTTGGYMLVIHNLKLKSMASDLRAFRPNLYRLMQISDQCFPVMTTYNYLFNPRRTRNRIEFIDDFPMEAEAISSLQIHPHGWCALSRSSNGEENQEFTTVHDIQERDEEDYEKAVCYVEEEEDDDDQAGPNSLRPTDLWMGYVSLDDYNNMNSLNRQPRQEMGIVNSGLIGHNASYNAYFQEHPEDKNKIVKTLPRLTHYASEEVVGKGYIKGVSFSSDGRVIASPYENGVRLLGFSEICQELSDCVPDHSQELKTIVEMTNYHKGIVVSSRFSPIHHQLVTGCMSSEIKWYQPVF